MVHPTLSLLHASNGRNPLSGSPQCLAYGKYSILTFQFLLLIKAEVLLNTEWSGYWVAVCYMVGLDSRSLWMTPQTCDSFIQPCSIPLLSPALLVWWLSYNGHFIEANTVVPLPLQVMRSRCPSPQGSWLPRCSDLTSHSTAPEHTCAHLAIDSHSPLLIYKTQHKVNGE